MASIRVKEQFKSVKRPFVIPSLNKKMTIAEIMREGPDFILKNGLQTYFDIDFNAAELKQRGVDMAKLRKEILDDAKGQSSEDYKDSIRKELKKELRAEIVKELREELTEKLTAKIRKKVEQEFAKKNSENGGDEGQGSEQTNESPKDESPKGEEEGDGSNGGSTSGELKKVQERIEKVEGFLTGEKSRTNPRTTMVKRWDDELFELRKKEGELSA